jgi:6-phosphofructokinase 1
MRIGVLTGGGDCPGLNAVIRAIHKHTTAHGHELVGFMYGWKGVMEDITIDLDERMARGGILHVGGTILRTSGANPVHSEEGPGQVLATMEKHAIDALIVIGGEGTMRGALHMHSKHNLPVIGVPKTIDNDLPGTDATIGFDSALIVATEALDRLHTTAESHDRVMVCEVMGRTAGWLALYSGIAGGANVILLPEFDSTVEQAADTIRARHDHGKVFSLVVVGEGYSLKSSTGLFDDMEASEELDEYGFPRLGGVSRHVAWAIEKLTGFETRVTILGHTQRGGSPSPWDRVLASRYGQLAARLAHEGNFGQLTALRGTEVVPVPLSETAGEPRVVPGHFLELAQGFTG